LLSGVPALWNAKPIPLGSAESKKKSALCDLLARLNSLSFYVLYPFFKDSKDENFYVGFTKNLKLRFEQRKKMLS
jgi:hypothetical protein